MERESLHQGPNLTPARLQLTSIRLARRVSQGMGLEDNPSAKLDCAWIVCLTRNFAKCARCRRQVWCAKLGPVEGIDDLEPELEEGVLRKVKVLEDRSIPLEDPRTGYTRRVAAEITEAALRLLDEGLQVKPFAGIRIVEHRADPGRIRAIE